MRVEKPSSVAFVFQVFVTIQGKTKARDFAILAQRLYNSYNHAMCQASTCGRVLAQGPAPSAPKQWKSDVHIQS